MFVSRSLRAVLLVYTTFTLQYIDIIASDIFDALHPDKLALHLPIVVDLARTTPLEELNDMPILHHALNLYFGSQSSEEKKVLVNMLQVLVARGVDVNQESGRDPDVLFKSLVLREMGLAQQIAEAGSILMNPMTLHQLYALPCDPIPLSKLLLHAEAVVEQQRQVAIKRGEEYTADNVVALLAGASLGVGAKPTVKARDLAAGSSTFSGLVQGMAINPHQDMQLREVMTSLEETASGVQRALFRVLLEGSGDVKGTAEHISRLLNSRASNNRNALHRLALAGGASLAHDLLTMFGGNLTEDAKTNLRMALNERDSRGHTPLNYAALRYGTESRVYDALLELTACAGAEVDLKSLVDLGRVHRLPSKPSLQKSDDRAKVPPVGDSGGWSDLPLQDAALRGDVDRCDILEVWGGAPTSDEFFSKYLALGVPVIFRNALSSEPGSLRHLFSKEVFLTKYGKEQVPVSAIPYARSFGKAAGLQNLERVVSNESTGNTPGEAPLYAFNVALPAWRERIERDVGVPSLLQGLITDYELQFYLGEAGTGAPVHFHGHAVNSLAHGEKRWFLFPPDRAFYSTKPSLEFVQNDFRAQGLSSRQQRIVTVDGSTNVVEDGPESSAMQCTQKAGDIIYVPTLWGHGTFNTMQSIGVAHEFSVDDICME